MVHIFSLPYVILWTSIATSCLAAPHRYLQARATPPGSPGPSSNSRGASPGPHSTSPGPSSTSASSSSIPEFPFAKTAAASKDLALAATPGPAAPISLSSPFVQVATSVKEFAAAASFDEKRVVAYDVANRVQLVLERVERGGGATTELGVAVSAEALNGLKTQVLEAIRGAALTINLLKEHSPLILAACGLVERFGIHQDPKVAAAIHLIDALVEFLNKLEGVTVIKVPPPKRHVEAVLRKLRTENGPGNGPLSLLHGETTTSRDSSPNRQSPQGTKSRNPSPDRAGSRH